jgi:hypothetical protein
MTRDELIEELEKLPYNAEVLVLSDGIKWDISHVMNTPTFLIILDE